MYKSLNGKYIRLVRIIYKYHIVFLTQPGRCNITLQLLDLQEHVILPKGLSTLVNILFVQECGGIQRKCFVVSNITTLVGVM